MACVATVTDTETYSVTDIEIVMRRFSADIVMIATSSAAITEARARDYAHDVELLAKAGYLEAVDLTLLSGGVEVRASRYQVNTSAGDLTMSRPGGVLWPRVANPDLRILLSHTGAYTGAARERMRGRLRIGWVPSSADTSHSSLKLTGGRDYASNGWGLQRRDYGT
jgi:Bacterial HORMA domain family 1